MFICKNTVYDRSDGVYHIVAGQVIGFCYLRLTCGFFMSLRLHDLTALVTKPYPCKGVDTVVNARVTRLPAPRHSRICGVDDRTAFERGNITFPKVNAVLYGRQICNIRDALALGQGCEIFVLCLQKILVCLDSRADINKASVKAEFILLCFGYLYPVNVVSL